MIDNSNPMSFLGPMRALKLMVISLTVPWLGSCGTGGFESSSHDQPHAVLKPEVTVGNFINNGTGTTSIVEIDGKKPSFWRMSETYRVAPGNRQVGLLATEGRFMSMGIVKFTAAAGKTYKAKSDQVGGLKMALWIEEAPSGKVVGKTFGSLQLQPPAAYTPPVFVPISN